MKRTVSALLALCLAACATAPQSPVELRILALNDFHGNLQPPAEGFKDRSRNITVQSGGAAWLASAVREQRAGHPNHIFVAAGDLMGASPLLSALFNDEPTIEALGAMDLAISSVGNHEFDRGADELLRRQYGGCHPKTGCQGGHEFKGASYHYLAASTVVEATGKTLLPAYEIRRFEGIPVGFIGLTLKGTPGIVTPSGVAGLRFDDEAETVNRLVPQLRAQGVEAIVVLIHEGGFPTGSYNECPAISGAIVDIVKKLDKAVDLVVSGHTHMAYNCRIDGRLVTSADKYGNVLTAIDLKLDRKTGDVISAQAENMIVDHARFQPDPAVQQLIAGYDQRSAPLVQRVIGHISQTLTREQDAAGATTMGQLIADAQLVATAGDAQIAITNIGGVRSELSFRNGGAVSYGDAFTVQPFYNNLVTLTLSGAQLRQALEQQWLDQPKFRPLQVSRGFAYRWDAAKPLGQRVVDMRLNGQPIAADASLRITVTTFLAAGGDGFKAFTEGSARHTGMQDIDALEQYLQSQPLTQPPALDRVVRIN
ncbi:bifunctional UDP-sugar hydrolase/5'-nucleotidase [Pelomonas sp. KK5]|uniref:bifunctional metallophosphatase/5'-nucleotidase n=1 Tax=Pelomonas sp. KK5 TaxID=1855730 RepID=UPI00097BD2EB|nr:bifunctional metallophosphatase/5'-nucleotidase [Pelomonas sp. KK5]